MIDPISAAIPTIGQRQNALKASIVQGLQQLAMQIYVQSFSELMKAGVSVRDADTLQQLAKDSLFAAQQYFSGLGIAQFTENQPNG